MIFDKISEYKKYLGLSKNLDKALELMATEDFSKYENGYRNICEGIDVNVFEADTHPYVAGETKLETHRVNIDIHLIQAGEERVAYRSYEDVKKITEYDESLDAVYYYGDGDEELIYAKPGTFMICFPNDAHMPCICKNEPMHIRRAVLKVRVD